MSLLLILEACFFYNTLQQQGHALKTRMKLFFKSTQEVSMLIEQPHGYNHEYLRPSNRRNKAWPSWDSVGAITQHSYPCNFFYFSEERLCGFAFFTRSTIWILYSCYVMSWELVGNQLFESKRRKTSRAKGNRRRLHRASLAWGLKLIDTCRMKLSRIFLGLVWKDLFMYPWTNNIYMSIFTWA